MFHASSYLVFIATAGALALASCGGKTPATGAQTPATAGETGEAISVSDWQSWPKVSKERFVSEPHNDMWIEIHVPAEYADAYVGGTAPAPQGMTVVKAQYPSQDAGQAKNLTVMVKMHEGYAPESGNWYWGVYQPDGTTAAQHGTLQSCIDCHDDAGSDYLYRHLADE